MHESTTAPLPLRDPHTLNRLQASLRALDDKKAEDLAVLYLGEKSTVADCFVLATGVSEPHLKALHAAVRDALAALDIPFRGGKDDPASGWMVVDAYDIIVHLFTRPVRGRYRIETLWKDAASISPAELLA